MAIIRNDNLDIRTPKPADTRMEVLQYVDLINLHYVYYGLQTYVFQDDTSYKCITKDGVIPIDLEIGRAPIPPSNQLWVPIESGGQACCEDDIYSSYIDPSTPLPDDVGGFKKSTLLGQYIGLTFSELFDILLFPTLDLTGSISTIPGSGTVEIPSATYDVRYSIFVTPSSPPQFIWSVHKKDRYGVITIIDSGDQSDYPNNKLLTQTYSAKKGDNDKEVYDLKVQVIEVSNPPVIVISRATFNIKVLLTPLTGTIGSIPNNITVAGAGTYKVSYAINVKPSSPTVFFWKVEKTDKQGNTTVLDSGDQSNYTSGVSVQTYNVIEGETGLEIYRLMVDEDQNNIWRNISTSTFTIDIPGIAEIGGHGVIDVIKFIEDEMNPNKINEEIEYINRLVPDYLNFEITEAMLDGNTQIQPVAILDTNTNIPLHKVIEIPKSIAPNNVKILTSLGTDMTGDFLFIDGTTRNSWIYIFDGPTGGEQSYPVAPIKIAKQ